MRVPKNLIKDTQYTSGGEYVDSNNKLYSGPYIEVNGKFFKGSKYNGLNEVLTKIINNGTNQFLGNNIIGKVLNLAKQKIETVIYQRKPEDIKRGYSVRYFIKPVTLNQGYLIKEVNEESYKSFKNNFLYQTISLKYYFESSPEERNTGGYFSVKDLQEAEKKMPGITSFTQSE